MTQKSILIVEDERIFAEDLKETLLSLNYLVTGICVSGEDALLSVEERMPDLILMDIMLAGELTGIQTAEKLLQRHTIPVIYLTAYADETLVERAKKTTPYGYLIKPFNVRELHTQIEIALYKYAADQELNRAYAALGHRVLERTAELTAANEALKKSEKRYRLLFERAPDGIFIFECEGPDRGRIVEVNEAGAAMHGYAVADMHGMKITDFDVPENLVNAASRYNAILEGEWIGEVVSHKRRDGTTFPIDFLAGLLDLGDKRYVFSIIRDISEREQAKKALELTNKKLNILNSITRHDILNQLAALFLDIEMKRSHEPDDPCRNHLDKIETIGKNIQRQIEFTRIYQDIGIRAPAWFPLIDVIRSAVSQLNPGPVTISVDVPEVAIYADPLIEKVFYNLAENALRHGKTLTKIAFSARPESGNYLITCEDDGVGVPPEVKERIFRREYYSNTGFGLYLSREILGITSIAIAETGSYGAGAKFEITVPAPAFRPVNSGHAPDVGE